MTTSFRRVMRDRRGATLALVALSSAAMLAMCALAIDLGMLFNSRAEAQRAADSAALAGASAYLDFPTPFQAVAEADARAVDYATRNAVRRLGVQADEVTVDVRPAEWQVEVQVRRESVPTVFARVFGVDHVPIGARAVAEAAPAGVARCMKPFAYSDPGFLPENYGDLYTIRPVDPNGTPVPSFFNSWVMPVDPNMTGTPCGTGKGGGGPSGTGASAYSTNICANNCSAITLGVPYPVHPGDMVGATISGTEDLIALDPNAYWDPVSRIIRSPLFTDAMENSPRVVRVPVYNHDATPGGPGAGDLIFTDIARFFIESVEGPSGSGGSGAGSSGGGGAASSDGVIARFLGYTGAGVGTAPDAGTFVRYLRLIG